MLGRIETALSGQSDAVALETMRSYRDGYRALVQALIPLKGDADAPRRQQIAAAIDKIAAAAAPFQ